MVHVLLEKLESDALHTEKKRSQKSHLPVDFQF